MSNQASDQQAQILQRAYDLLARREHSRAELTYKLARIEPDPVLLETVLDKLCQEGLQSDERFTESFVHHCMNKGQGSLKINQALQQRGVAEHLIDTALHDQRIDWLSLAEQVRVKKYGLEIPKDYKNKARQSRFLYSRGFNQDVINQLLK